MSCPEKMREASYLTSALDDDFNDRSRASMTYISLNEREVAPYQAAIRFKRSYTDLPQIPEAVKGAAGVEYQVFLQ